jgi:hypothetical protein
MTCIPLEADPPLLVDADAVLALTITLQGFELIGRRVSNVGILRQILLIIVVRLEGTRTEVSESHRRASMRGRFPVDVTINPSVDQTG